MNKITLFIVTACVVVLTGSSCKKAYDFIHDHPNAHDSLCRITRISFGAYDPSDPYSINPQFDVTYNTKGNPTDLQIINNFIPYVSTEQHFRYDIFDRVSDWMFTYAGGDPTHALHGGDVVIWHKFIYPRPGIVYDTVVVYTQTSTSGPRPNAGLGDAIYIYKLDGFGRINAMATTYNLPDQPPPTFGSIVYDANGNKVLGSGYVYDNAVNVYRTNKVWQFVYNDYSRNNPVPAGSSPTPVNQFELPTQLPFVTNAPLFSIGFSTSFGNSVGIEYACSMPKGPINY